jgi:SNF2 family DNA or RNA helicase
MVRNRRGEVGLRFTDRHVHDIALDPSPEEAGLYGRVLSYITERYEEVEDEGAGGAGEGMEGVDAEAARRRARGTDLLRLMLLERELVSSSHALAATLRKLVVEEPDCERRVRLDELYELCVAASDSTKARHLLELARTLRAPLVVFTQFIPTQEHLCERLAAEGLGPVAFNGAMSPQEKEFAVERFRSGGGVLVCTDSGSEGRNLQFANVLVNYDLPWNPMRLEQRIGRVHRIGQERDVHVFNLTLRGTIEDHILSTLYRKIDLFTCAIGEMDLVLSNLSEGASFERRVFEASLDIEGRDGSGGRLDRLAADLAHAQGLADKVRQLDERVLARLDLSALGDAGVRAS